MFKDLYQVELSYLEALDLMQLLNKHINDLTERMCKEEDTLYAACLMSQEQKWKNFRDNLKEQMEKQD